MDGKGDCLIMYYIYSYTAQVVVKHQEIMGEIQCLQSINHIKYSRLRREKKEKGKTLYLYLQILVKLILILFIFLNIKAIILATYEYYKDFILQKGGKKNQHWNNHFVEI